MRVYESILDLVGNTPLVKIKALNPRQDVTILAKLEYFNPSKSVKDRAAYNMICEAEKTGMLKSDSIIIEATSGNTGIALATIAAAKGYKLKLIIPDTMSIDKINQIKALGAEVILTPGIFGMKRAYSEAAKLLSITPNGFMPNQMENKANPDMHYKTTATEIWNDTDGKIDILVAGIGTGGTISGTARGLKEKNRNIRVVGIEPSGSPVLSGGVRGPHKLQGVGAGFIPNNYDQTVVDQVFQVGDNDALETSRRLAREEALFVGISSGAAMHVALKLAESIENKNKIIVAILPDTGERYLSTELFNNQISDVFVS